MVERQVAGDHASGRLLNRARPFRERKAAGDVGVTRGDSLTEERVP